MPYYVSSMNTRLRKPCSLISDFVTWIWCFEGSRATRELLLPIGTTELVVSLEDNPIRVFTDINDTQGKRFGAAAVCGPQSRYFVLGPADHVSVVGAHFKPGGAFPFLGLPLNELNDQHVALEDLWGPYARSLRDQLLCAGGPEARMDVLEQALISRLAKRPAYHPVVAYALNQFGAAPAVPRVKEVSTASGYSAKRFIQLFEYGVGLTPKRYCRVRRFQDVIARLTRGLRVEWADVAADCGYYDQSHLIHDFREMAGMTPAQYQPIAPDSPNHARF